MILDEPDFSPVKEPASIEPMEVPHEDEDAICHSLAKASLTPLDPPKLKRFEVVPVISPLADGQRDDRSSKGGGALPTNPLLRDIPLDDLTQKDTTGVKEKPQPAKNTVDQGGQHDRDMGTKDGKEIKNLMKAPAIPKRSFLVPGPDPSAGEEATPTLQDFVRPKPKSSSRRPVSPRRSRSHRRNKDLSPARRQRDMEKKKADAEVKHIPNPETKQEFLNNIVCFANTLDGLAPCNLHVAAYFYEPSRKYPLTHPRQLSAVTLRRNSNIEKRWVCWQCSPEAGFQRYEAFTVNDHACHWWSTHAGDEEWRWWDDAMRFEVSMAEILQICGVDLRREPLPLNSLQALPRHIPSHPSGVHDSRLFEYPFNLSVASPQTWSEQALSDWNSQWALIPYDNSKHNHSAGHQVTRIPIPPSFPPPDHLQEAQEDKFTEFGWIQLIPEYTEQDPETLETVISPAADLKEYCDARKEWHHQQCSTKWLTTLLLKLEEHAFYLTLLKLMGTKVLTKFPIRLDDAQKSEVLSALWSYPRDLERRMERSLSGVRCSSDELSGYIRSIQGYVMAVVKLDVPITSPWNIPRVPGLDQSFGVKLSYASGSGY